MSDPVIRVVGDMLHYGAGEFDWVRFGDPIKSYEVLMDNRDIRVLTEESEYILCSINDTRYMRVIRIKGKSLQKVIL